jgi:Na+/proline symporter
MSTTNLLEARRASIYSGLLNGFITLLLACTGLYIHAFYRGKGYDPTAGDPNSNKIMFIFLLEYSIPGLVGVVFSAVLGSTISVVCGGLNAAATSFYVDILQNVYGWTTTPTQVVFVSRIVTAGFGVFVTLIAVFSTMLRMDIVNFSNSVSGLFGGPVCAVFLCGMFTKVVNTNGIALGVGVAFMILLYVAIGDVACQHIDSPDICNNGFLYYSRVNPWMISFWLGLSTAGFGLGFSYLLQSTSSTRNQQVLEEDL